MSVLVVGTAAIDEIETPYDKCDEAIGGSAVFFATAASLFTDVRMVAVVGHDFPESAITALKKRSVDVDGLERTEGESFRWSGRYLEDWNSRETLATHLNVLETFDPKLPDRYRNTPYVFLANIDPDLQLKVLEQVNKPKFVALDTMNFWIHGMRESLEKVLEKVDMLVLNDEELCDFTGTRNIVKGCRDIMQTGIQGLVVKRGEHGALLYWNDKFFYTQAFPLETVVDPTGAGDSFAGGFMGSLVAEDEVSEESLKRAMVMGCLMGSFSVEGFSVEGLQNVGAQELRGRMNRFLDMTAVDFTVDPLIRSFA